MINSKYLLCLVLGIIIGTTIGVLISAIIGRALYFTTYSNEIGGYKANYSNEVQVYKANIEECDNRLRACREDIEGYNNKLTKCRENLDFSLDEHLKCKESLAVCSTDLNLCLSKGDVSSGETIPTTQVLTIPATTTSSSWSSGITVSTTTIPITIIPVTTIQQQDEISPERVKNFINRINGINSLSSDAVFVFDIIDIEKYTVYKTPDGIQVSSGESSERDIVLRTSKYYFEVLESSSNFCKKLRELYDENPKKVWYEEPKKEKICSKGYTNIYLQCIPGNFWERIAVGAVC